VAGEALTSTRYTHKSCTLKTGIKWNAGSDQPENKNEKHRFFKHINELWAKYNSFIDGKLATQYVIPSENPFSNWDASDRYANENEFTQERVQQHQKAAKSIQKLVKDYQLSQEKP
tara:strand:+ start:891 stop:1238 length:348 start_codon:yes stop_codon:yes gene_type:complete